MQQELPGKLWLDVLSKADLLEADFTSADAAMHEGHNRQHPTHSQLDKPEVSAAPDASAQAGHKLQQHDRIDGCNSQQQELTEQHSGHMHPSDQEGQSQHSTQACGNEGQESPVKSLTVASQAILSLPNAIRISSVTQSGIEQLQSAVMQMLTEGVQASIH